MVIRFISVGLMGAVLFCAGRAEAARCISGTDCLCNGDATIYDATITGIGSGTTTFSVNATHGIPLDGGSPATIALQTWSGDQMGQRYLVFPEAKNRSRITNANQIQCNNIEVPLAQAAEIAVATDCETRLASMGFVENLCETGWCGSALPGSFGFIAAIRVLLSRRRRNPSG